MYYNNNDIRLQELPKPVIGRDEFLLKVKACGICGSDVMQWYRIKKAPLVLGHEAVGVIEEAGQGVKKFKPGDRVFVAHHVPCNSCRYCLEGFHTVCQMLHTTNFYPGGFSEYIRVPQVNVQRGTFLLPDRMSFKEGACIEPLACVVRGQRLAGCKSGQVVLILGAGVSGLLHLLLARAKGAEKVIVSDINEYRLKKAKELGADLAIRADSDITKALKEINNNRLADLVIVCTSAYSAFKQALGSVDRAGTILCFAPTEPGVELPIPVNDFWRKGIKILPSYGAAAEDTVSAIELIKNRTIDVNKIITHQVSLDDAGLGFKMVADCKDSLKVIVEP